MSSDVKLSVVIPAYNEEARLVPTLRRVIAFLDDHDPSFEILVVDDGSSDHTAELARDAARDDERVQLIALAHNRGKGAAVREGMLAARGRQVLFSDADLATPIEELTQLQAALARGHDIAIASRGLSDSQIEHRQHPIRELMGRTFNVLVRAIALGGFKDTQCGFKLFTREAARELFGRATIDGFAFDVEILLMAKGRYRIAEVPVRWRHVAESKLSPSTDSVRMFLDLLRIRVRRWTRTDPGKR